MENALEPGEVRASDSSPTMPYLRLADKNIMDVIVVAWFVLAFALIIGELFSLDLTLVLLGAGATAAGITAALGAPLLIQLPVFIIVSFIALAFIRPIAKRHVRKVGHTRTGVDRLPGQTAVVLESVTTDGGLIKLDGENWTARLDELISTETVPAGNKVTVLRVEGATAIVHAID